MVKLRGLASEGAEGDELIGIKLREGHDVLQIVLAKTLCSFY